MAELAVEDMDLGAPFSEDVQRQRFEGLPPRWSLSHARVTWKLPVSTGLPQG